MKDLAIIKVNDEKASMIYINALPSLVNDASSCHDISVAPLVISLLVIRQLY